MKKLLLADDSKSARVFFRACVAGHDYEITEAADGQEAVKLYETVRPDAVFMDLTMPVLDGFSAIGRIREIDRDARIVVLTADVQKATSDRIMALGAVSILRKPPSRETIVAELERLFPDEV